MASPTHAHQHSVKVIGSGVNLEQAFSHAMTGLLEPGGHYSRMAFHSFEVVKIAGTFDAAGGKTVLLTLEAYASHRE